MVGVAIPFTGRSGTTGALAGQELVSLFQISGGGKGALNEPVNSVPGNLVGNPAGDVGTVYVRHLTQRLFR